MLKSQDDVEQTHNAEKIFKYEESAFLLDHEESNIYIIPEFGRYSWVIVSATCLLELLKRCTTCGFEIESIGIFFTGLYNTRVYIIQ